VATISKYWWTSEAGKRGGPIGNKHQSVADKARGGFIACCQRWHEKRGIWKKECPICNPTGSEEMSGEVDAS
jgi:hypothetical protein